MAKSTTKITVLMAVNFGMVFLTQIVLAAIFGARFAMDAYLASTTVPFLVTVVFLDSSRATLIPVFVEHEAKSSKTEAWEVTFAFANVALVILLFITILGVIIAPWLMSITVPGFDFETRQLAIILTRIIFPTVVFNGLADILSCTYYARERPFLPSVGPFLSSSVIFVVVVSLVPQMGIKGLALGTLLGSTARFLILVPGVMSESKYRFSLSLRHPGVLRIGKLMPPVALGALVVQTSHLVDRLLASHLPEGSVTYLGYGYKIATIMVVLLRDGMSLAILPPLANYAAENDIEGLRKTTSLGLRMMMLGVILVVSGLAVLNAPIVQLMFERGAFTAEDTRATALTLLCYSGIIFSWPLTSIATQTFYALQDTKTVMKVVIAGAITDVVLAVILVKYYAYAGIASALSVAALLTLITLLVLLNRRLGGIQGQEILRSFVKMVGCSFIMVLTMVAVRDIYRPIQITGRIISLGLVAILGGGVFMGTAFLVHLEEVSSLKRVWSR